MGKYAVVVFTEEDGVGMVPLAWCKEDKECYWPPYKSSDRFEKAVRAAEQPGKNWTMHPIRILSKTGKFLCLNMI